jgi:hypothetical protein
MKRRKMRRLKNNFYKIKYNLISYFFMSISIKYKLSNIYRIFFTNTTGHVFLLFLFKKTRNANGKKEGRVREEAAGSDLMTWALGVGSRRSSKVLS